MHKPAEWSPLSASLLAEIAADAGLPAGVLNVVHGLGETAGKALTEHEAIKAIAFVGESATGSAIMAQGAPTLKRVHFAVKICLRRPIGSFAKRQSLVRNEGGRRVSPCITKLPLPRPPSPWHFEQLMR